jgi:hypothetical protein
MVDEPHEVVKLLLKRMDSHPDEFKRNMLPYADRWQNIIADVLEHGNEADTAAINAALRDIRLGEAHEDMMDELCNGDERRRKEEEEQEYERNLAKSLQLTQQQAVQQQLQQYQNAVGQRGAYDYDLDRQRGAITHIAGAGPSLKAVGTTGTLTNTINQIREMLGAKK